MYVESVEAVRVSSRNGVEINDAVATMQDRYRLDEWDGDTLTSRLHILKNGLQPFGFLVGKKERVGLVGIPYLPRLLIATDLAVPALEFHQSQASFRQEEKIGFSQAAVDADEGDV